jgi:hypothetical protein
LPSAARIEEPMQLPVLLLLLLLLLLVLLEVWVPPAPLLLEVSPPVPAPVLDEDAVGELLLVPPLPEPAPGLLFPPPQLAAIQEKSNPTTSDRCMPVFMTVSSHVIACAATCYP